MFPPPKPLSGILLTSLITASILTPHYTPPNHSNLPALLLPTNDTTTLPNSDPADPWYPYASTSPTPAPSSSNETTPQIVCNGERYGRNLRIASCLEAYNRMDSTTVPKTYGERDADAPWSTPWDANLPLRILSSDALCAIDISHSLNSPSDTIPPSLLKSHALALLAICVQGTPSIGGVSRGLGEQGHLALRVTPYRPHVRCSGAPGTGPPWVTCREVIDSMPVGGEAVRFGPEGDVLAQVVVPWVRTTGARRCGITIDTVSQPDVSDFYKLWAAANAVDTLCVIKGKAGMAVGNGLYGNLVVGLADLQRESGNFNGSTGGLEGLDATA